MQGPTCAMEASPFLRATAMLPTGSPIWYLQFQLVFDKRFASFLLNDLSLLGCAVGGLYFYFGKGSFLVRMIGLRLLLAPLAQRAVFGIHKKRGASPGSAPFCWVLIYSFSGNSSLPQLGQGWGCSISKSSGS